jgi:hypothetical protein
MADRWFANRMRQMGHGGKNGLNRRGEQWRNDDESHPGKDFQSVARADLFPPDCSYQCILFVDRWYSEWPPSSLAENVADSGQTQPLTNRSKRKH